MMKRAGQLETYEMFARGFTYPGTDYSENVRALATTLAHYCNEALPGVTLFCDRIDELDATELEELFTRTFDVQAITTLDVAYVLFGDDYKRGQVLVHLTNEFREAGVECGVELPDHLPNLLRLLPAMQDEDLETELVHQMILPALQKMIAEFEPASVEDKNKHYLARHKTLIQTSQAVGRIYRELLDALYHTLLADYGEPQEAPQAKVEYYEQLRNPCTTCFSAAVKNELEVEK